MEDKEVKDLKDHEINLTEYIYGERVNVEIPGKMLEGLIQLLRQVEANETEVGFAHQYPTSTKYKTDKDGKVKDIKVEFEDYPSAEEFFNQRPQTFKSMLGTMSQDLLLILSSIHLENIRSGKALKIGSIMEKPKADVKIS